MFLAITRESIVKESLLLLLYWRLPACGWECCRSSITAVNAAFNLYEIDSIQRQKLPTPPPAVDFITISSLHHSVSLSSLPTTHPHRTCIPSQLVPAKLSPFLFINWSWCLPRHFCAVALGKLLTSVCLLLSPGSITWYRSMGGDALRLGRWHRSGDTLAMCGQCVARAMSQTLWFIHLRG